MSVCPSPACSGSPGIAYSVPAGGNATALQSIKPTKTSKLQMSSCFLQREDHRMLVLSTFKIKKGLSKKTSAFFLHGNRVKLPSPFLLWNSHFLVHSVKEMLESMLPDFDQYRASKDQEASIDVFSECCRILSVFFNPSGMVLAPARNRVLHQADLP